MNICVVPARGGSVRVPRKNIKPLNGKPLIGYTIQQALKSKIFNRVIVSTEDSEIAMISMLEGAEVFHRPKHLAEDVESELVIIDVIKTLEKQNIKIDTVTMLQCTSPLRKVVTIERCVNSLWNNWGSSDSACTVNSIEGNRPEWMCFIKDSMILPYTNKWNLRGKPIIKLVARQDLPKLYKQNGCVYTFKRDLIMHDGIIIGPNCIPIIIDEEESLDIDVPVDFTIIEEIMKKNEISKG